MVCALTFSYNHQKKVLTIVLAIMFGLVVSNGMDAYSHFMFHCAPSAKKNYVLQKDMWTFHVKNGAAPFSLCFSYSLKITTELLY